MNFVINFLSLVIKYTQPFNNTVYMDMPSVTLSMTSTLMSLATVCKIPSYEYSKCECYSYESIYGIRKQFFHVSRV